MRTLTCLPLLACLIATAPPQVHADRLVDSFDRGRKTAKQAKRLSSKDSDSAKTKQRLAELRKLRRLPVSKITPQLVARLRRASLTKSDSVRLEAVLRLGDLAFRSKRPCPVELAKAALDRNERVRVNAVAYLGLFKKHEPGCLDYLFQAMKRCQDQAKSNLITVLADVAGNDPRYKARVAKIIQAGKRSRHIFLNHNSHIAELNLKSDLQASIPFFLRRMEEYSRPAKDRTKQENESRKFIAAGCAYKIRDFGMKRTKETVVVLLVLTRHQDALIRRVAARTLGAIVQTEPKKRPLLVSLKVKERLEQLQHDKDKSVRRAANIAIAQYK